MNVSTSLGTARDLEDHFVPVADVADLDRLFAESAEEPIILYKHDFACGISANAYRELAALPGEISLIDVERQKQLAAEVASRTGIRHESPQVIVVRTGRPVYAASHWDITGEKVARAAGVAPT